MKILGISVGELSTAALLVDGEIVSCVSEERFSRSKNDESFPIRAIEYCLKNAGITGKDLDEVAISSLDADIWHMLTHYYSRFKIKDHIEEQKNYWYPSLYKKEKTAWHQLYKDRWDLDQYPHNWKSLIDSLSNNYYLNDEDKKKVNNFFVDTIHKAIGISKDKIKFYDHHSCHTAYAYWASPFRDDPALVLTIDAYGDGTSATISVADGNEIKRLKSISHKEFQLARMYRYTTLILGMKPNEHEYKVMGLAPYAKPKTLANAYEVYKNTMYVDGLDFKYKEFPTDMYFYFKEKLDGERFDGIAGGLQKYCEEILVTWVKNAVKATGVSRIALAGGVAMNIKAMKCLADLPEVSDIFIPPSTGDESNAIGVCYHVCKTAFNKNPSPLKNAYLGPAVQEDDIASVLQDIRSKNKNYEIVENVSEDVVAANLAAGRVLGRCAEHMEFGARSLGNRSILADPRNSETIQVINEKIKNRDFWMPFAPAILKDATKKYLVNPKEIDSPFMTLGFDTTPEGAKAIAAATHPSDKTARPQMVTDTTNPGFAKLIKAFERKTGVGSLLNTSFNLHGEPVVCTAQDAYRVFELSGIDDLLLNNVLISKRA